MVHFMPCRLCLMQEEADHEEQGSDEAVDTDREAAVHADTVRIVSADTDTAVPGDLLSPDG